ARGLQDAEGFLDRAVLEHVVKIIQKYLESHSPPKEGPLKTIDKWPAGLIGAFASGFSYNNVQYAINQAATQFANTFDKSVKAKSSTWWQSVFVPTGSQGLLWGEGTKDNSWQYEAFRQQLLKPTPVKEAYENRVKLLAGKDEGLSAFTQVRTYNKEQQQRQELLAKVGSYDKQRYENFFNQWYDQSLMVGDLGKITLNDIKTFVSLHPDRAKMPAWHDRIVKANPDLYYEAIGRKILPLAAIPEGWSNKTRALDGRIMYEGGGRVSQTTQRTSSVFDITNAGGIVKASEGGYDWKEGWDFAPSQWGNLSTGKHWILDEQGQKIFTDKTTATTATKEFKDSPFAQGFDAGTAINKFQWQEEKTWTGAKGFNEWLQEKFDTWRKTTQGSKGWSANNLISWADAEKAFTEAMYGDVGVGGKARIVDDYVRYLKQQSLQAPTEAIKKMAAESGWGSIASGGKLDYLLSGNETTRGDLIKGIWERLQAREDNPFAGENIREIMTQVVST
ncbi:MAG TPA: hypothetical protein PLS96_12370, partial [Myxococcota bacterium]|nr:hypothetical protein [Myxococcota bacterium]